MTAKSLLQEPEGAAVIVNLHVVVALPKALAKGSKADSAHAAAQLLQQRLEAVQDVVRTDLQDTLHYKPNVDYSQVFFDRMSPG